MQETTEPAAPAPARRRRWPRVLAGLLLALILAAAAAIGWLASEHALRLALDRVVLASRGQLTVEGAQGSLLRQVRVARLAWKGEAVDIEVRDAALTWNLWDLASRRFTVTRLVAGHMDLTLHEAEGSRSGLPSSLALPLEVDVKQVSLRKLAWATPQGSGTVGGIAFRYAGGAASHRIDDLRLTLPEGSVTGAVAIGAQAPFVLQGGLAFVGSGVRQDARATVTFDGPVEGFEIAAEGTLREARLVARVAATPLAEQPFTSAEIDARALDLARWDAAWPSTDLSLKLVARPDAGGLLGTVDARNAQPAAVDAGGVPVESLTARFVWRDGVLSIDDAEVRVPGGGAATGRATVSTRGAAGATGEGTFQLRQIDVARILSTLPTTRLAGALAGEATGARQSVRASLRDEARNAAPAGARSVELTAVLEDRQLRIDNFRAQAGGGTLVGRASLALDGRRPFNATARAAAFDPSRFADLPRGLLKGTIEASGTLAPSWDVSASVALDAGSQWADTALSGRARARATPGRASDVDVQLRAASATLSLDGAWGGASDRLGFALDAPRLADLLPLLQRLGPNEKGPDAFDGAVKLKGSLSGSARNPGLELDARAKALRWGELVHAATLDIVAQVAPGTETSVAFDKRALQIAVTGTGLVAPQGTLQKAQVKVTGTLARHEAALSAAGAGFEADAALVGGLQEGKVGGSLADLQWAGRLERLRNEGRVALALEAPAKLVVSRSQVALGSARITIAEGHADVERFGVDAGRIDTRGSFTGIPVTALARLAGSTLPFESTLMLGGDWNLLAAPRLNGAFKVQRERGDIYGAKDMGLDESERAVGLTALGLRGRFVEGALDADAVLRTSRGGSADAELAVAAKPPGGAAGDAALSGTLRADLTTLRPFQPWLGTAAAIDGRAGLDASIGGTLARPSYSGALTGDALRLAFPQHGVQFQDGRLRARLVDRTLVLDELSLAGGAGRFVAEGTLAPGRADDGAGAQLDVRWRADQLTLVNQPELQIVAGGNGRVTLAGSQVVLNGSVDVVRGNVVLAPVVAGRLSNDVVIVGRPRAGADARGDRPVPLALDIDLGLGPNFRFSGGGLESRLEGRVRFTNNAAGVLFANGTIRAAEGTYTAFGQRLVIDRGKLIFNGRADNPALDVLALRRNLAVEAGVEVQGTVRTPIVRLVSNPPVPEGEQLSWLITGQGLNRASSADMLALSAASAALLYGGSRPLASALQSRLGVDDVSLREAGSSGGGDPSGQVVALSRRVSDRLTIVYELGLAAAESALRIEYALTQTLTLRADAGTASSVGLYFWRAFD